MPKEGHLPTGCCPGCQAEIKELEDQIKRLREHRMPLDTNVDREAAIMAARFLVDRMSQTPEQFRTVQPQLIALGAALKHVTTP